MIAETIPPSGAKTPRKREVNMVVDEQLIEAAKKRAAELGLNLSNYIRFLILMDLKHKVLGVLEQEAE